MTNFIYAKKDKPINPQTFSAMVQLADEPWVRSLLVYLYLFGVRISEAIKVSKDDFSIEMTEEAEWLVVHSLTLKNLTDTSRTIYMSVDTVYLDILRGYLASHRGGLLWPYSRIHAWRKITALNKEISPHVFRHNRLTRFALEEATAFQIRDFAGHTDLRPATSYIKQSGVLIRKMMERIVVR